MVSKPSSSSGCLVPFSAKLFPNFTIVPGDPRLAPAEGGRAGVTASRTHPPAGARGAPGPGTHRPIPPHPRAGRPDAPPTLPPRPARRPDPAARRTGPAGGHSPTRVRQVWAPSLRGARSCSQQWRRRRRARAGAGAPAIGLAGRSPSRRRLPSCRSRLSAPGVAAAPPLDAARPAAQIGRAHV